MLHASHAMYADRMFTKFQRDALQMDTWRSFMDEDGRIADVTNLKKLIFFKGVSFPLRREVVSRIF